MPARRVLLVHPSAELYGSDRVALESAMAFLQVGWQVDVTLTEEGPLRDRMEQAGARVHVLAAPVLRKAYLSPLGLVRLGLVTLARTPAMVRLLRSVRPDVVYVSTVTVPWWLVLARVFGRPLVVHVHEAEEDVPRPVRVALAAPLLLAGRIVANSRASREVLLGALPRLAGRTEVIDNGVPGPAAVTPLPLAPPETPRLVLVGRVSPRKGTDVAVTAAGLLRDRGHRVTLDLVGGVFPGYEWFETEVRDAVAQLGLDGAVTWRGVLPDVWKALDDADVVLVPSRVEPFGNAAVEGLLAGRPVVAGDTQGLREIVVPGVNGELAAPGDAEALADAVERVLADWPGAVARAEAARTAADDRFSPAAYRRRIAAATLDR